MKKIDRNLYAGSQREAVLAAREAAAAFVVDLAGNLPAGRVACPVVSFVFPRGELPVDTEPLMTLAVTILFWTNLEVPVYIACENGRDKSALLAGLVMKAQGMDGPAAVTHVQDQLGASFRIDLYRELVAYGASEHSE